MDDVLLDANVLFSAAWSTQTKVRRLWSVPGATLVSSQYAVDETMRNLGSPERRERLASLLRSVRLIADDPSATDVPEASQLPKDDRPILFAAVACRASHLLTGN